MITQQIVVISGALFGGLAVIFGAFGAHALKKILSEEQLKSFETGVKYQMYHALVLLFIGNYFSTSNSILNSTANTLMSFAFIIGTFLFSFSIYGLVLSDAKGKKMSFLGPITPLGGLLLVIGWILLLVAFI
ncbi:DUF423 domain-containing protein [Tenacibaculum piscium]|uniref:DUF423 domain-containing protein n=1 Tax=Tenacibaculum piscium TaxID=1458515 RepID=A0A2H1YHV4_9FLAO|nr:DUF423 domain-containing protein [Tenacibaculum piscium]MBE7629921.1 DUF423 domain-containing protein [Tenacibaculum piscium]MBE7670333.1 DUF423 domain-containing protein [Tenacibaculum piscium]MBE7685879.1 DUF423 domain-containing protein [Tenacibaculum piscium]MBE7690485.1 DUF423 domain-containing protein [Tenacibaculum piscium]MCG8183795.1 DUF423 domain-containing protein [Tenacibaculum piscium]